MKNDSVWLATRCAALALIMLACVLRTGPAGANGTVPYEKPSTYGTIVVTDEGDGVRALRFGRDGVRQSLVRPDDPEYLGLPYITAMLAGLALSARQQRFLVIGLGGGTLPAFLRKKFPDAGQKFPLQRRPAGGTRLDARGLRSPWRPRTD